MNRRDFLKSLYLVPSISNSKLKFELFIDNKNRTKSWNYKHYFYGGARGGGKTWKLNHPRYNGIIDHIEIPEGY